MEFSHLDKSGRARMVDIGPKKPQARRAVAEGRITLALETVDRIKSMQVPKGHPFEVARIAGIQAAKRTADLIPLCHTIDLDFVDVSLDLQPDGILIRSEVACRWATGVEMEALTAVSVAALTLYDMCKAVDDSMRIEGIRLVSKTKGNIPAVEP